MKFLKIKKLIALVGLLSCATGHLFAQQKVNNAINISGEFNEKVSGKLDITYRKVGGGRMEFDSAKVVDGKFKFTKPSLEPIVLVMALEQGKTKRGQGGQNYGSFYLNPGEVKFTGSSNLKKTIVIGSGTIGNKDYQVYLSKVDSFITIISSKNRMISKNLPEDEKEKFYQKTSDSINLIRDEEVFLKVIKETPKSLLAVLAMNQYAAEPVWTPRKKMQPEVIEKLLATLPAKYKSYPSLISLKQELQISKSTGIGKPVIDFTLKDASGKTVSLSDFKGKYVFLDFWASWCIPCRKENPNVKAQYEKYKNKNFTVLSVSMDKAEARKAWTEAIEKDGIGMWTHLIDEAGFAGTVAKSYYITSIPTNFLISPEGKFLGRNLYGEKLDQALEKIFTGK